MVFWSYLSMTTFAMRFFSSYKPHNSEWFLLFYDLCHKDKLFCVSLQEHFFGSDHKYVKTYRSTSKRWGYQTGLQPSWFLSKY